MRPAEQQGEGLAWRTDLRRTRSICGDQFQFQRDIVRLESETATKQRAKIASRKLAQHFWLH